MGMMKRAVRTIGLAAGLMLAGASLAQAQMLQWQDKGFLNIGYGVQSRAATDVSENTTFSQYDEQGKIAVTQTIKNSKGFFDISGGARIWQNLGLGIGYSAIHTTGTGSVTATVPHPLLYDSPRTATASATGLEHKDSAVHLFVLWMLPLTDKLDIAISGGPTWFTLTQNTVGTPSYTEVGPPYTSVTLSSVSKVTLKSHKNGANIGADVTYKLTGLFGASQTAKKLDKMLGVGAYIRWSGTSASVTTAGGSAITLDIGGLQMGFGARIRF
jgi:hypothetical protein